MSRWLVKKDGRMFGPFGFEQVRRLAESGKIDADTLVRDGNSGPWELASHVSGLLSADAENLTNLSTVPDPFGPTESDGSPFEQAPNIDTPLDRTPLDFDSSEADSFDVEQSFAPLDSMLDVDPLTTRSADGKKPSGRSEVDVPGGKLGSNAPSLRASPQKNRAAPNRAAPNRAPRIPAALDLERNDASSRRAIAGLLSLCPGGGHIYLGLRRTGLAIMGVVLTLYVALWGSAIFVARLCINASASPKTTDPFAGRLIADSSGSSLGISVLVLLVLFLLTTPLFVHFSSIAHAIQSADSE